MRSLVGRLAAVVLGAWWLCVPGVAFADDPIELDAGQITDRVEALGDRRDEVEDALADLDADHQLQLFVVYVDSFSGLNAQDWADETAQINGLGLNDALLAVATGDRQYAYSVHQDYPLTDDQLAEVATVAIEPALRQNDWAAAAIGAAEGYAAVLEGEPVGEPEITPGEEEPSAGGFPWLLVAAGAGVATVGLYAYSRSRRRAGAAGEQPAGERMPSIEELDARASQLLVATDDAVKTSEQELGFATAQFGEEAAAPFAAALAAAKEQVSAAFRIRQQLDDAFPEDEAARRTMLNEIIQRCEEADQRLDAEADAFDRLRDLERNAPQRVAEVEQDLAAVEPRLQTATGTLESLGSRFADSALAAVVTNPEQAQDRITFARAELESAKQELAAGSTARAAVSVRAAEDAVAQAGQLLDAVDRLGTDLDQASAAVQTAITETAQDLAEARALIGSDQAAADLASQVAAAEAAVESVQQEIAGGRYDPLAAIRRLRDAGGKLDQALAGARDRRQQAQRARASLEQALLAARSEISATQDFITTRRGAVGGEARTRLAEAQRHFDQAIALAQSDPVTALAHAQQADLLAEQAGQLARADVGAYSGGGYGGFGRGGLGGDIGGAILGGILIDSMLGGRRGGGFGGGFGGGRRGGGGGFGGGRRSAGSFGGSGTRGRRSGGGRF